MDRPSWPQGDPGKVLLHLDASCSVDTLFDCFFGSFPEFQAKLHKERGDSNIAESPWVMDRSQLPAEQYTWPSVAAGPAAGTPKTGAMRKVRFDAPPSPLVGKGFSNEEVQKVIDHAPGSHYRCESEVFTSAMYGDKFVILTRYIIVARGPGAAALHVTYTVVWSPSLSGFLKPMIGKGVEGGIKGTFAIIRKMLAAQSAVVDRPEAGPPPALPGIAAPAAAAAAELAPPAMVPVPAVAVAAGAGAGLGGAFGLTDYLVYQELVAGLSGLPDPQFVVKALAVVAMLLLLGALVPLANTLAAPVQALCGRGAQGWLSSLCWPLGHVVDVPDSVAEVVGSLLLVWAANKLLVGGVALLAEYLKQAAASRAAAAQRAATRAASPAASVSASRQPSATAQPAAAPVAATATGKGKAAPAAAAGGKPARGGRGKQKNAPAPVDAAPAAHPLARIESSVSEGGPAPHMHATHSAPVLVPAKPARMSRSESAGVVANGSAGTSGTEPPMSSSPLGEGLQAITKVAGAMSTWGRSWLGGDLEAMNSSSDNLKTLFAGLGLRTNASESTSEAPAAPGAAAAAADAGSMERAGSSEVAEGEPGHRRGSSGSSGGAGRPKGRHGHQPSFTTLIHDPSGFNIIEDYAQTSADAAGEEGGEGGEGDGSPPCHRLVSLDEEAGSKVSSRASSPDKGGLLPIPSKTSSKGSSRSRTPSPDKQLAAASRAAKKQQARAARSGSPGLVAQNSASSVASSSRPGRNKSPGPWGRANSLGDSLDAISTGLPEEEEGDVVDEEVFEYERHQPFRGWGHTWPGHFLPSDKVGHWGDRIGQPAGQASELFERVAPRLPIGWVWAEPQWELDMMPLDFDGVDGEGWSYGVDFSWLVWPPQQGMGKAGYKDWTRRRRWIRRRVRVSSLSEDVKVVSGPDGQPMVVLPRSSDSGRRLTLNSEAVRRAAGVGSHGGDRPLQVTLSAKSVPADMVYQAGGRYVDSSDEETDEAEDQQQHVEEAAGAQPAAAAAAAEEEEEGDAVETGSRALAQSLSENALTKRPEQPKAAAELGAGSSRSSSPSKSSGKVPATTAAAAAAGAEAVTSSGVADEAAAKPSQQDAVAASQDATGDEPPAAVQEQPAAGMQKQKPPPPPPQQQQQQQPEHEATGGDKAQPSKMSDTTKAVAAASKAGKDTDGASQAAPVNGHTYGVASAADEAAAAAAESLPAKPPKQPSAAASSSSSQDSKRHVPQHTAATGADDSTGGTTSSSSGNSHQSPSGGAAAAGGAAQGHIAGTSGKHGGGAGAPVPGGSGAAAGSSSSAAPSTSSTSTVPAGSRSAAAAAGGTDPLMGAAVTSATAPSAAAAAGVSSSRRGSSELPSVGGGVLRSTGPSMGSGDWVWSSAEAVPVPAAVHPSATSGTGTGTSGSGAAAAVVAAGGTRSSPGGAEAGALGSTGTGSQRGSPGSSSSAAAASGGAHAKPQPGGSTAGTPHSPTAGAAGAHRLRISTSQSGSSSSNGREGANAPAGGGGGSSGGVGGALSPGGSTTHARGALVSQRSQDSLGSPTGLPRVLTSRASIGSAGSAGSPRLKEGRLSLSGGTPNKNHMDEWQQW